MVSKTDSENISKHTGESGCKLFEFSGKSLLFIGKAFKRYPENLKPDFIVITKSAAWNTPYIISKFPQAQIILDSSWGDGQLKWLKKQIKIENHRVYSVLEKGAFEALL
jgi:hypothetical protein